MVCFKTVIKGGKKEITQYLLDECCGTTRHRDTLFIFVISRRTITSQYISI